MTSGRGPGWSVATARRSGWPEFNAREAAALAWIDSAFARATSTGAAGVLLLLHAEPVNSTGFTKVRARILQRSAEFGRSVLLVHGDEHRFESEPHYGGVANLTRLETFGNTAKWWIRLSVDPQTSAVFSWTTQTA